MRCNLFLVSFVNFLLFRYVSNDKNKLCDKSLTKKQLKWIGYEYLIFPIAIVFGLVAGMSGSKVAFLRSWSWLVLVFMLTEKKDATKVN
jgi:hypothetical protein